MLDSFIIEELKRREQGRHDQERPGLQIPAPSMDDYPTRKSDTDDEEKPKRGVIVIDLQV